MKHDDQAPNAFGSDQADGAETQSQPETQVRRTAAKLEGDAVPGLAAPRTAGPNPKAMIAFAVLIISMLGVGGYLLKRVFAKPAEASAPKTPDVASLGANKLRLTEPSRSTIPVPGPETASAPLPGARAMPGTVPALKADEGAAQPIPVVRNDGSRASGQQNQANSRPAPNPIDAPVFAGQAMASSQGATRAGGRAQRHAQQEEDPDDPYGQAMARLGERQKALQEMLDQAMGKKPRAAAAPASAASYPTVPTYAGLTAAEAAAAMRAVRAGTNPTEAIASTRLFGSMEQSPSARAQAQMLAQPTLTIPRGTLFTCALKTRVVTATSGMVGCLVQRNVYGQDGKVLLVERGSHIDGEYRMMTVKPGLTRIPVIWSRILTPAGVTVELESPATGQLGESGIGGYVDNRWLDRIGAAMLVSLVDDAVKLVVADQNSGDSSSTVYLPSTTAQTSKLAEEVLKSTINIPPLLYANQGGVVGVYVARDLDFSAVYKLQPQ